MRGEGQRAQHGTRADVRRGLLATDVLLAGRKRQDKAAFALGVDGFAGKAPGHLPHMLLAAREQADIWPAELKPDADALAFSDDDVGAHFAGRPDRAQG